MDSVAHYLKADYEKVCQRIGPDHFASSSLIGYQKVLRAHYLIADYFTNEGEQVLYGVKSDHLLLSAVGRQMAEYEGHKKWKEPLEYCATLFFGLIKNHAFHDGNKRTAFLILLNHLLKIGRTPDASQSEFEDLAVATAGNFLGRDYPGFSRFLNRTDDPEVHFIADFLRKRTRKSDMRSYVITFLQLERILRRYGMYLDEPNDNSISVLRKVERKLLFGLRKKTEVQRVARIGFPGWKKQVSLGALRKIRREANLTPEFGIDSQVFFRDAEALDALIGIYHGPLQRLKDR